MAVGSTLFSSVRALRDGKCSQATPHRPDVATGLTRGLAGFPSPGPRVISTASRDLTKRSARAISVLGLKSYCRRFSSSSPRRTYRSGELPSLHSVNVYSAGREFHTVCLG